QTSFNDRLVRTSGVIQAAATVGQPQNMPIPSAGSTGASTTSDLQSYYYTGFYPNSPTFDSYSSATVNPSSVYPNWQLAQSNLQYHQQQQQHQPTNQSYDYGSRQNIPSQQTLSIDLSNNTSRLALTSGQSLADPPSRTLQYTSNNVISTAYTYETPHTWISDSQQIPLLQTNVPSHMNAASGLTFD
ncbi:unnamed protein product, partial [Rotaria sp. Silwood2]